MKSLKASSLLMSRGGSREVEKLSISDLSYSPYLTIIDNLNALLTSLFSAGEQGAIYIPKPVVNGVQSLFQDSAGTAAVTADGDPVGLVIDQSGNGNSAAQSTSSARPTYKTSPDRLSLDKVDDELTVNVPAGGWTGTMVLATDQGTASYGVSIDAGAYDLGGEYFPGDAIVGALFRDGAMTAGEKADAESYFVGSGATESYGEVASFRYAWRDNNLTSFPLIDTSSGTDFRSAWRDNNLTSFPLIDTSSGTDFRSAWYSNAELVDFPANFFDNIKGGNLDRAFDATNLNEASIDGILVSLVTSGIAAGTRLFDQSGGSAPSVGTGQPAIDTLRSRGWAVTVTGGY